MAVCALVIRLFTYVLLLLAASATAPMVDPLEITEVKVVVGALPVMIQFLMLLLLAPLEASTLAIQMMLLVLLLVLVFISVRLRVVPPTVFEPSIVI